MTWLEQIDSILDAFSTLLATFFVIMTALAVFGPVAYKPDHIPIVFYAAIGLGVILPVHYLVRQLLRHKRKT